MERDFLGLNSKNSVVVKEETVEGACDSGFGRVPWLLSNKVSALPHFMPVKFDKDENSSKIKSDLLPCHGYGMKCGSDMFEVMQKRQTADIQNGNNSANTIHESHIIGAYQSVRGNMWKQQFLGGSPYSAVAGMTDHLLNSKASNTPAQLTIFYGGTVNIFDDVTPEKAQAIMFLAGAGCVSSNVAQSKPNLQMQAPAPMSVSCHPVDHSSFVPPFTNDDAKLSKTVGVSTNLVNKVEPPRLMQSIGSVAASAMISSAVPQARKASLARFLEKRKERAMTAAPYNMSKNTGDCATPESAGFSFSATSGVGSSSVHGD